MKIIELLNKIAKNEELPKTIYYKGDTWYLEQKFSNRLPYYKNGYSRQPASMPLSFRNTL